MADTTFTDEETLVSAAWLNDINDAVYNQTSGFPDATARTLASKLSDTVSVLDFGADKTAVASSTAAFQAAIDYVEQTRNSGGGGVVYVPAGSYRMTGMLRIGGLVRLVGENWLNTSLFWDTTYTSGNCVELGPDDSGLFGFSGSYTFASRLENIDLNAYNVYRGATSAVVYTVGAHQFSGLTNVSIRNFRNYGVHYDVGTGDPATFHLHQVEITCSATPPTLGDTIGVRCNAGGALINMSDVMIQGDAANLMDHGILMVKDHLTVQGAHFENCTAGISLTQNETILLQNFIASVSGHTSVPELIYVSTTNNVDYNLFNVSNQTITATSLTVLHDYKTGLIIGGTNGRHITNYSSTQNTIEKCTTVKVTTAELLALNATPKTIIAAPDSGFAVIPNKMAIYKPAGTAYAGIAAGEDLVLKYTNASGAECSAQMETTGFLDQAGAETRYVGMPAAAVEPVAAAAVVLHLLTGEITTGTSDLYVRVWYDIIQTTFTV